MSVEAKIRSLQDRLNGLSDWITEMERQLGSEQPMEENLQPLNRQNQDHDVSKRKSCLIRLLFHGYWQLSCNNVFIETQCLTCFKKCSKLLFPKDIS